VASALAVLVVLAGSYGGYRLLSKQSCAGGIALSVAAAPDIAPAIEKTLDSWTGTRPRLDGRCVSVDLAATEPADVAAAIAGAHKSTLGGVGQASGKARVPDVWIADSSLWLQRLRSAGSGWVPSETTSLATSPIFWAMPESAAKTVGWPDRKQTWPDLYPKITSDISLRPGIVEPLRDSAGLTGLLTLAAVAGQRGGDQAQQATVRALRSLATGRSALRDDLLARFPRSTDIASVSSSLSVAPLSEQSVISFNGRQPPVPLAALYVEPAAPALDYPYVTLPGISDDKLEAARAVLDALGGDRYRRNLAAAGLRPADGVAGGGLALPRGAPATLPKPAAGPDPAVVDQLLSTWSAVTSPGRILAAIDISGSMLTPVPSANNATRAQVTIEAARRGLALFDDSWAVGLWEFSTQLEGNNDYRQLVPIGTLADQRQDVISKLGGIRPKPNGETGLYDTTLAAYTAVQNGWDPGRVNSVVIMTDGKNEDGRGLSLDQLVDELKKAADPGRPVQVIAIGIGNEVSEAELRRITDAAGGGTFIAPDPSKVGDIFLKAIALRTSVHR